MKCSDEISVGEYVRTNNHGIKRIDTIWENKTINKYGYEVGSEWDGKLYSIIKTTDIVKHSKDIKDLLQIGDIIITNNLCGEITKIDGDTIYLANYMGTCNIEDIESIITKEQIKQMEFRIKE